MARALIIGAQRARLNYGFHFRFNGVPHLIRVEQICHFPGGKEGKRGRGRERGEEGFNETKRIRCKCSGCLEDLMNGTLKAPSSDFHNTQ